MLPKGGGGEPRKQPQQLKTRLAPIDSTAGAALGRGTAIGLARSKADADLIVMSTHAYTGPARALPGSTADALVRTTKRPVLSVRRPAGAVDYAPADSSRAVSV